jgi:hypothetical protein
MVDVACKEGDLSPAVLGLATQVESKDCMQHELGVWPDSLCGELVEVGADVEAAMVKP